MPVKFQRVRCITIADVADPTFPRLQHSSILVAAETGPPPPPTHVHVPPPKSSSHEAELLAAAERAPPTHIHTAPDGSKAYASDLLVASEKRSTKHSIAYESSMIVAGYKYLAQSSIAVESSLLAAGLKKTSKLSQAVESSLLAAGEIGPTLEGYELYSWFFNQDGHVFYVLQIGQQGTYVYDLVTGKWCQWKSSASAIWKATHGIDYNQEVIAVVPQTPLIVKIIPEGAADYDGTIFERVVTAYLKLTTRATVPIGGLYVDMSYDATAVHDDPLLETSIAFTVMTLRYSDDGGMSWKDFGSVKLPLSTPKAFPVSFRSLGVVRYPGKLLQLRDWGGPIRISGIDVILPQAYNTTSSEDGNG